MGRLDLVSSGQLGGRNEPVNVKRVRVADEADRLGSGR